MTHLAGWTKDQTAWKFFGPALFGFGIIFSLLGSAVGEDSDRGRLASLEAVALERDGRICTSAPRSVSRWWNRNLLKGIHHLASSHQGSWTVG